MPLLIMPNRFVNGTVADADLVNQNYTAIVNVVNALDHDNVGAAGFFANQIKPTNDANATFLGSAQYTFRAVDPTTGVLKLKAAVGQTARILDVEDGHAVGKLWIDGDFTLHASTEMYSPVLSMLPEGKIVMSKDTGIQARGKNLNMHRGSHYDGSGWVADGVDASMLALVDTGLSFYANGNLTENAHFLQNLVGGIDIRGFTLPPTDGFPRYQLPYGHCSLGQYTNGLYLGWNAHHEPGRGWIAEGADAILLMIGAIPGQANIRFAISRDRDLTVGQVFTPSLRLFIDNNESFGSRDGFQPRSSLLNGTTGPRIFGGAGIPVVELGGNGDYFFRTNGTPRIYFKTGGAWVAIVNNPVGVAGADEETGQLPLETL